MSKLMDKLVVKRRHLIVDAEDVLDVLGTIQAHYSVVPEMRVGCCGWVGYNKWFIHFDSSNEKWDLLRHELQIVRVFSNSDIPKSNLGVVYTTD